MNSTRILTAAGLAAASALLAAAPAHAGVIDGSLNNAHALSNSNVLGAMVNSVLMDASNNNANAFAEGALDGVYGLL